MYMCSFFSFSYVVDVPQLLVTYKFHFTCLRSTFCFTCKNVLISYANFYSNVVVKIFESYTVKKNHQNYLRAVSFIKLPKTQIYSSKVTNGPVMRIASLFGAGTQNIATFMTPVVSTFISFWAGSLGSTADSF